MSDLRITVAGNAQQVASGTTAADLFVDDRTVVVARVNGELRDLDRPLADGDVVEPVTLDSEDGLAVLRHSCAHVLAQAVQDTFADAKLGIGPPIQDGFYYDFDVDTPFHPDDLKRLEKRMQQIIKSGQRFGRRVVTEEQARAELVDEPYKLELIGLKGGGPVDADVMEVGGAELTIYENVDARSGERQWQDLCRGPHLPSTRQIPAFKLMRTAAAYWRGSEKNPQLQRIYGTAWPSKDAPGELPELPGGGREARPPPTRHRARPLQLPGGDRLGARGLPPQGWRRAQGDGGLLARPPRAGGLRVRLLAAHHQAGALRDLRAPRLVRRRHVPADAPRRRLRRRRERPATGAELLPQADELPVPQPDLPVPRSLVPRAAAAALRVRVGLPVREVRGGARPHPGPGDDAGRRAHLLHEGADAGRARQPAHLRARPAARLRPRRLLPRALHARPREVRRHRRRVGGSHGDASAGRGEAGSRPASWTRAAPPSTDRRSRFRPRMRSDAPGRCRRSRSTSSCRSASSWSTRPPTGPGSSR